jgi:protein-S-isoprenylcysteine O-methyltransferase Ste14
MLARERFAWVQLTALVLIFGVYFPVFSMMQGWQPGPTFLQQIGVLSIALGLLAVIVLVDRMRTWFGPERKVKPDERDRLIEYRASAIGYYVLMGGVLYVGCYLPFVATDKWQIVNATLFFVVVAEVVKNGLVVLGYRRGLRG